MKRKIIKQGHNTLTITLPSKWGQELNLKAGDEIDISERENGLFISSEKQNGKLETEIDITGLNMPTIWKYFMSVYREGYDEVKVKFNPLEKLDFPYKYLFRQSLQVESNPEGYAPLEMIQEIINRFIGFEVVEHHQDYCIIKDFTEPSSKEFDSSLRRIFLLIQQMAEELVRAITTNNKEILKNIFELDVKIDKFEDYCVRVLNKTKLQNTKKPHTHILFATLSFLELVGDEYKFISHSLLTHTKDQDLKNLKILAEKMRDHFDKFHSLYYSFDKNKLLEISKENIEIYTNNLPGFYKKKPNWTDDKCSEVFYRLASIGRYINALSELRVEMEF